MRAFRRLIDAIEAEGSATLVTLTRVEGSSPREAGVRMVVRHSTGVHGTIGGGRIAALDAAQRPRTSAASVIGARRSWRKCCGAGSEWRIETFDRPDRADPADRDRQRRESKRKRRPTWPAPKR